MGCYVQTTDPSNLDLHYVTAYNVDSTEICTELCNNIRAAYSAVWTNSSCKNLFLNMYIFVSRSLLEFLDRHIQMHFMLFLLYGHLIVLVQIQEIVQPISKYMFLFHYCFETH